MSSQDGQRGFTLVELILVILLIGLSVSFVTLRLAPASSTKVEFEARQFATLVGLMEEESIITGQPIAVIFDEDNRGYRFLKLGAGYWEPVEKDDILRPRPLAAPVELKVLKASGKDLIKAGKADDNESGDSKEKKKKRERYDDKRMIVVDLSGITSSFEIEFYSRDAKFSVAPDEQGLVQVAEKNQ